MKRLLTATCCLLVCVCPRAQVTMTLQVPPAGVLLKQQLWNVNITNGGTGINCSLDLVLTDEQTSQVALSATTKLFVVPEGSSTFTETDLGPVQYSYPSAIITDRSSDGFLNAGRYHACYTLYLNAHGAVQLQQVCEDITVEPVSPPMLILPADRDTILTNTPQFNWIPPAPLNIFGAVNYHFLLVEVLPGQTPALAIQQNMPVYSDGNVPDVYLAYPISYNVLDTGKLYAWQVIANDNDRFGAQSDIWTFTVKPPVLINMPLKDGKPYTKLKLEQDASLSLCDGVIKVVYNNESNDTLVNYTITGLEDDNAGQTIKTGPVALRSGENYIDIPASANDNLADDKTYLFELVNSRNERWSMKFIYHQPAGN